MTFVFHFPLKAEKGVIQMLETLTVLLNFLKP